MKNRGKKLEMNNTDNFWHLSELVLFIKISVIFNLYVRKKLLFFYFLKVAQEILRSNNI